MVNHVVSHLSPSVSGTSQERRRKRDAFGGPTSIKSELGRAADVGLELRSQGEVCDVISNSHMTD